MNEAEIDLSKFYFVRPALSTKGHKEEVEHQFQGFLLTKDADLQATIAKSIFSLLYDELDKRFNEEISEDCSDTHEIFRKKGLDGKDIKSVISYGIVEKSRTKNASSYRYFPLLPEIKEMLLKMKVNEK